jgi:hypothetical protein
LKKIGRKRKSIIMDKPISEKSDSNKSSHYGCIMVVLGCMAISAMIGLVFVLGWPLLRVSQARDWQEVPCTVVSSQVKTHHDSDGTSYSALIVYQYSVHGKTYMASRYRFGIESSGGYKKQSRLVAKYPPGKRVSCYVNPQNPKDAVLRRDFAPDIADIVLWLFLSGISIGVIFAMYYMSKKRKEQQTQAEASAAPCSSLGSGRVQALRSERGQAQPPPQKARSPQKTHKGYVELKPRSSPWAKFLVLFCISIVWYVLFYALMYDFFLDAWKNGIWAMLLAFIPAIIVGVISILLIWGVLHNFLRLFYPSLKLMVLDPIYVGGTIQLQWEVRGGEGSLQRLHIYLEGREEATYTFGTSTCTDKEIFCTIDLCSREEHEMLSGQKTLALPPDIMHSWEAEHNKILWELKAKSKRSWLPEMQEEFAVEILPKERGRE